MKPENMINMIRRFTDQYGVTVTWFENEEKENSRGKTLNIKSENAKTSKVLLLKEKFNPLQVIDSGVFGLTQDYTRYVLTLPDVEIKKDMVITDNHGMRWKLGIIDWFDIGGVSIAKQSALTEVK